MVRCRGVLSRIENCVEELDDCYIGFVDQRKVELHLGEFDQLNETSCNGLDAVHTQVTRMKTLYAGCVSDTCYSIPEYLVEIHRR